MEKEQWTSQLPLLEMHLVEWVDRTNHKHIIINDFVAAEKLVVELSNIQKIIQILNSNEAKTWVHNNDADTGPAGSTCT